MPILVFATFLITSSNILPRYFHMVYAIGWYSASNPLQNIWNIILGIDCSFASQFYPLTCMDVVVIYVRINFFLHLAELEYYNKNSVPLKNKNFSQ